LAIIQTPGAAASPKAAGAADKADTSPAGIFSAILDALLGGSAASTEADAAKTEDPDPLATVINASNPQTGTTVDLLKKALGKLDPEKDDKKGDKDTLSDLVDALTDLNKALQSGQAIDPSLLQKVNDAVASLAGMLGVDLTAPLVATPTAPGADATAAAVTPTGTDPKSMLAALAAKVDGLAKTLGDKAPDTSRALEAVAQKLASGDISAETLDKLGFTAALQEPDNAIGKKLATLLEDKPAAPATPALSAPSLKVPDGSLKAAGAKDETKDAEVVKTDAKPETPSAAAPAADDKPKTEKHTAHSQDVKVEAVKADPKPEAKVEPAPSVADSLPDPQNQNLPGLPRLDASVQARAVQTAYQANTSPINLPHLAFEMAHQFEAGKSKFQIRLDPPELGRIDVHMDVDRSGNVNARMTVEKAETLDLLQRDQSSLQKALAQAGVEGARTNLEFSLRQNGQSPTGGQQQQQSGGRPAFADRTTSVPDIIDAEPATLYRGTASAGALNLFV
jgi:flagellar hook-length control protein FliK